MRSRAASLRTAPTGSSPSPWCAHPRAVAPIPQQYKTHMFTNIYILPRGARPTQDSSKPNLANQRSAHVLIFVRGLASSFSQRRCCRAMKVSASTNSVTRTHSEGALLCPSHQTVGVITFTRGMCRDTGTTSVLYRTNHVEPTTSEPHPSRSRPSVIFAPLSTDGGSLCRGVHGASVHQPRGEGVLGKGGAG